MTGWHEAMAEFLLCLCVSTYFGWRALKSTRLIGLIDPKSARPAEARSKLLASHDPQSVTDAFCVRRFDGDRSPERIAAFSIAIARALDVSRDQITVIARAAFLRDIGLPPAIANKSSPPTADEITAILNHCDRGYQMLKADPHLAEAAEIVYAHEEWFDGSGYPRGLKGQNIPLGARIVSVAAAWDALAFEDPQRRSQSLEVARKRIMRGSGTQFDPAVVRKFRSLPEDLWSDLCRNADPPPSS